jgi:hypothetical protein
MKEGGGTRILPSIAPFDAAEAAAKFADALVEKLHKKAEPDEKKWSLFFAKAGEILINDQGKPFIYNGNWNEYSVGAYCGINNAGNFVVPYCPDNWTCSRVISPASDSDIDILFDKMTDAGYVWYPEEKILKKMMKKVNEGNLITGETKDEAIERYRAMMKVNEGKSFEERRDAINNFRAGR